VGELTAVAVWNEKPTPELLLTRRLEYGWQPILTGLQGGAEVLGYAACLLKK